jgi:hypothetical protein
LCLIASADGAAGSVRIHQDARVYAGMFDGAEQASVDLAHGRGLYVHVARGRITANGTTLEVGDALKWWDPGPLTLSQGELAEVLVFDLPLP